MKDTKKSDNKKVKAPKAVPIPFVTSREQKQASPSKKSSKKKGVMQSRLLRKQRPMNFVHYKVSLEGPYPAYSDYLALKRREQIRRRQEDFVDGKFRGFLPIMLRSEASRDFDKQLYVRKQRVQEFAKSVMDQANRNKRETLSRVIETDTDLKSGGTCSSGKKESTTASRSLISESDKHESQELVKNAGDIRSWFDKSETCSKIIKNPVFQILRTSKTK
jgi:hypothetical protein